MKRKLGTLLEEDVIRLAKRRAVQEARPLNGLIQDALVAYLGKKTSDPKKREEAYRVFCERPILITREQFDSILKKTVWDL
jgi:hypothetical protein